MGRLFGWSSLRVASLFLLLVVVQARRPVFAQVPPAVSGVSAGTLSVSGGTWTFDADIALGGGPWMGVIVTNLSSCDRPLPIPGTAQAGAIVFTAQLSAVASQTGHTVSEGDLLPFRGSAASGYVLLTTPQEPGAPTHVDAGLFGLEQFAVNNTLRVCLVSGPGTPSGSGAAPSFTSQVLADVQAVLEMGYDATGVVTTASPVGSSFIGISGVNVASADGASQWVFFFSGTTYLGTDTADTSPSLSLAGSPGSGLIDVKYSAYAPSDPLCCPSLPPVTITYTWDGTSVTASSTPPGH
jgi:LppP/LprE lipoprotein